MTIDNSLVVSDGITISGSGLKSTNGDLTVAGGVVVDGRLNLYVDTTKYVSTGDLMVTDGGLTVKSDGLRVVGYPYGASLVVTGGFSIVDGGILVQKGGLMVSA
jgi:hypothetical protein